MSHPHRLKLYYDVFQNVTATLSQGPWIPSDRPIGGGERSAAGVPSNYIIRHEPLLEVVARIEEADWPDWVTFLRTMDDEALAFSVFLDADEAATATVYLESPSVANGDVIRPTRDDGDPSVFILPLTFRRTSSTIFDVPRYS